MGNGRGLGLIALIGLVFFLSKDKKVSNGIPPYIAPILTIPTITIPFKVPITEIKPVGWHRQVIETKIELVREEAEELDMPLNGVILPHEVIIKKQKIVMPPIIDYPQVTKETRLPPDTQDYERELEKKYPVLLPATRERYAKARKALGLREYVAPPMPIETGGARPGRVTR